MAIAERGTATNNGAGTGVTNILTLTKPTGVVSGDLLIACITEDSVTTSGVSIPTGWTRLISAVVSSGNTLYGAMYYKVAGGSEPSSYSWGNMTGFTDANLIAYSGVDNTTSFDVTSSSANGTANLTIPGITTVTNGAQLLIAGGNWTGNTPTATAGYTKETTQSDGNAIFDKSQATAGATGTVAYNGGSSSQVAFLLALRPAGGGGAIVSGTANMQANAAISESAQIVASANVQANAVIAETAQLSASANVQANATLAAPAQIVSAANVQANAAIGAPAQIVASAALQANAAISAPAQVSASAPMQANAAISAPARIVAAVAMQANALLVATGGIAGSIVSGTASMVANAAMSITAQIVATAAPLVSNSAIGQAAQIVSAASIQANASIGQAAQIVVRGASLAANAVLSALGSVLGQTVQGYVTLSDAPMGTVALTDADVTGSCVLSDAAQGTVTLSDAIGELAGV